MTERDSTRIWRRRGELDKERRVFMQQAMAEFDIKHAEKVRAMQADCGATTGHTWAFTHPGPIGGAWFHCRHCGASQFRKD